MKFYYYTESGLFIITSKFRELFHTILNGLYTLVMIRQIIIQQMSANNSSLQITKSLQGTLIQLKLLIPHEKVEKKPIIVISSDEEGQEVVDSIRDRCAYQISNISLTRTANNLLARKKETRVAQIQPRLVNQQDYGSSDQMEQSPPRAASPEIERKQQKRDRTREKDMIKERTALLEQNERQKSRQQRKQKDAFIFNYYNTKSKKIDFSSRYNEDDGIFVKSRLGIFLSSITHPGFVLMNQHHCQQKQITRFQFRHNITDSDLCHGQDIYTNTKQVAIGITINDVDMVKKKVKKIPFEKYIMYYFQEQKLKSGKMNTTSRRSDLDHKKMILIVDLQKNKLILFKDKARVFAINLPEEFLGSKIFICFMLKNEGKVIPIEH